MAKLESVLQFLEGLLRPDGFPDYPHSLNGLQVAGPEEVGRVGAAVDASEEALRKGRGLGVDLLVVHHGLFWDGLGPLTGPRFRKVETLVRGGMALYSVHLPLDAHPEVGNCALLARAMGLEPQGRFGSYKGAELGWWAQVGEGRGGVLGRLREAVGGEVRLVPGGPEEVGRVGILTGAGATALGEAASMGLDSLITGEAPHHAYHEAMELGINLFLAGHYATETFGVKAVAERVGEAFGIPWEFLHLPTGL